jgi:uroporphyrinogen-III synthase
MVAQSRAISVILTRPAEQGARFAQALLDRFGQTITVVQSPLLAPQFLQPQILPKSWSAVIFTSATAVAAAGLMNAATLPRKAYCVGDRTAVAATAAGFSAISAKGNAAALCAVVQKLRDPGPLLHLRGEEAVGQVAETLTLAGIDTFELVTYREVAQTLSAEALAVLSGDAPVILPVFSPRSALILGRQLAASHTLAPLVTVAISHAVADALGTIDASQRYVADSPDAPSMLSAIGRALIAVQAA